MTRTRSDETLAYHASLVFTLPWTRSGRDPERMLGWAARMSTHRSIESVRFDQEVDTF
jgi:hypothetical protein